MVKIGDHVIYVDEHREAHDALVTAVWGDMQGDAPGINCVFVSSDEEKHDPYGRQIDRNTSVVHESNQSAPGVFWREVK